MPGVITRIDALIDALCAPVGLQATESTSHPRIRAIVPRFVEPVPTQAEALDVLERVIKDIENDNTEEYWDSTLADLATIRAALTAPAPALDEDDDLPGDSDLTGDDDGHPFSDTTPAPAYIFSKLK